MIGIIYKLKKMKGYKGKCAGSALNFQLTGLMSLKKTKFLQIHTTIIEGST